MDLLWEIVFITALAGMGGTGLGGVVSCLFRKDSSRTVRASGHDLSVPKCPIQTHLGHFYGENRPIRVAFSYLGHRRRT